MFEVAYYNSDNASLCGIMYLLEDYRKTQLASSGNTNFGQGLNILEINEVKQLTNEYFRVVRSTWNVMISN